MPAVIGMIGAAVGGRLPPGREAVALTAEHERDLVETADGVLDLDGVRRQGQRDGREARGRQVGKGRLPRGQAGPGQREHRAHGDLDRPAVHRVGAARREQHGVEAERRATAEDRTDVGVVDDVLEHQHRPSAVQHRRDRRQRRTTQRGQGAAVHVEAGDLLGDGLGDDVAGGVGRRQDVGEAVEPPGRHQERAWLEAGLDRAAYDLLPLGEEQAVLGLEVLAEVDVAQVAVVGQPSVRGVGDVDEISHRPRKPRGARPGPPRRPR